MTSRQWSATLGGVALFVLTLLPLPSPVRVVAGLLFVVLVPGLAVRAALVGGRGPVGEREMVAIAAGLSVAGFGALFLVLVGGFGRWQFLLVEAVAATVAGIAAVRRSPSVTEPAKRRLTMGAWALMAGTFAVVIVLLSVAFTRDAASARAQEQRSSVALAAVRKGSLLELEVIAGGTTPFSGSVSLGPPGAAPMIWPVRGLAPGATWSVEVSPPAGPLHATLQTQRLELRSLSIAPAPGTESGIR